jgi:6-phosphogluconolactonase
VDAAGRNVLVANYTGGTVALLPLTQDGSLRPAAAVHRHDGHGPNPTRQEGPHAHAILLDPREQFAFEANLGTDRIYTYRFDPAGHLEPHQPGETALDPGAGPRHLAWHPSGQFLYVVNELQSTVTAFRFDRARGALAAIQTITTLPPGFAGRNTAAEIAVDANGRFLYSSNRGHDSLAVFAVDEHTGMLTPSGFTPSGGRTPRHFAIERSGRWLLAANQDSNSLAVFHLDATTGRPSLSGRVTISKPVCVLFASAPLTPR